MAGTGVEKRCKASKSEFREIWPGLKRCMVCGFALASSNECKNLKKEERPRYPKEDTLHSTYHGKFYKVKSQYGFSNILDYKVLKEKEVTVLEDLKQIKKNDVFSEREHLIEYFNHICSLVAEIKEVVSESLQDDTLKGYIVSNCELIQGICKDNLNELDIFKMVKDISSIFMLFREVVENIKNLKVDYSFKLSFNEEEEYNKFESFVQIIPSKLSKVESILNDLYTVEFTRSIRLWDMCKAHPRFEDYVALLWNTPKFLNYIKSYMTENQFNNYVQKYKANRQLEDFHFNDVPFYFGNVALSYFCSIHTDCSKDCKNCPYGCIDLSYTDKLVDISDEDDSETSEEITKEDEEVSKSFEALGKILNK